MTEERRTTGTGYDHFYNCDPPSILYKYFPSGRLDVLANRNIRFTQPGDFNDPFEFRPRIESAAHEQEVRSHLENNFDQLVDDELKKYGALLPPQLLDEMKVLALGQKSRIQDIYRLLEPGVLEHVSSAIDGFLNQNVGVLCLSEVRDSILMWGHYTDDHRGFVVGFDSKHPFFSKRRSTQDEFGFLRRVHYQRQRPNVILTDTSSPAWFQTKSDQWSYEREWRIVRVLSEAGRRIDATPFPICLFELPADAVLEIVVGLRATPSVTQEITKLASNFPRAKVLRAREDRCDFGLIID